MPTLTLDGIQYDDNVFTYPDLDFATLVATHGGGYMSPAHSGATTTGYRTGIIGSQWVLVGPDGKVFSYRGLFGIDTGLYTHQLGGGASQQGRTLQSNLGVKFSGAGVTWAQSTQAKLTRCHFHAIGPFSNGTGFSLPGLSHKSATRDIRRVDRAFQFWGYNDPVKDIARCMAGSPPGAAQLFYRPSGQASDVGWGDWFDPKYAAAMAIEFGPAKFSIHSKVIGFTFEESDAISKWLGDGHPNERGGVLTSDYFRTYTNVHIGMAILWSRPTMAVGQDMQNVTHTFNDPVNHSKARCIQMLKNKYANSITALNNAWNTGGFYTSFDSVGAGWGNNTTGLADESGVFPRAWFGVNCPTQAGNVGTGDYHTQGVNNNIVDSTSWGNAWTAPGVGAPNLTNGVKVDLDQMYRESVEAWIKPVYDTIKARDPGLLFCMVNNWGFPLRPMLAPLWNQYNDFFCGASLQNPRISLEQTLQDANDHMNYLYPLVPKPHIVNFYIPPRKEDSCLYYFPNPPQGWMNNTDFAQYQFTRWQETMTFRVAGLNINPTIGWQKWEYFDNTREGLHWGISSLNDNLYDGRDYRNPLAGQDPYAAGRTSRSEDFVYTDMLGFGGTSTLQRPDLLVGLNIRTKQYMMDNFADTTGGNVTMPAVTGTFALTGFPAATVVSSPNRLVAQVGTFALTGFPAVTTKGTVAGTFTDTFNRADNTNLGPDWQEVTGDLRIINNQCFPLAGSIIGRARRTADVGSADHYAQAQVFAIFVPVGNTARAYVEVRGNATDQTCYRFGVTRLTSGVFDLALTRVSSTGVMTALATSLGYAYVTGSTLRLEVVGSVVTGKIGSTTVLGPFTDPTPILTGQRTGFSNMSGTNSTADFIHDNFQSGNLGALPNTTMAALTGLFTLTGFAAVTTRFGIRLGAEVGLFTLTGQDIVTTRSAQTLTAEVGLFTLTGQVAATFKTEAGADTGIFRIRVLRFVPGKTALLILRATVPSGQEFFYADPAAVSLHPVTTAAEDTALRAGTIVEKRVSVTAPGTFAALQTLAEAEQAAFQAEVDASDIAGMTGLYGVGTRYSGTDWA